MLFFFSNLSLIIHTLYIQQIKSASNVHHASCQFLYHIPKNFSLATLIQRGRIGLPLCQLPFDFFAWHKLAPSSCKPSQSSRYLEGCLSLSLADISSHNQICVYQGTLSIDPSKEEKTKKSFLDQLMVRSC